MDTNFWVNDDTGRYYIQERHQVSGELALLRVDKELPFYSELRKAAVGANELLTIYGSSAAGGEPIYDSLGDPVGWTLAPTTHHPGLRWGQARSLGDPWVLQWLFTRGDPLLGPGGINCAGIATNDSGGGIFTGSQVAGVTYGGNFSAFRLAMNAPPNDCGVGLLFTTTNLWHCGENKLLPPARAHGVVVHPYLSNIFAKVSPPIWLNAGGPTIGSNAAEWDGWSPVGPGRVFLDVALPIDTSLLRNPAPQKVYQSQLYLSGAGGPSISFMATNLIKYERYHVRLHFASINVADAAGRSVQRITANDQMAIVDPYSGSATASDHVFYEVSPDSNGCIAISISPENAFGNASVCGIEVSVVPRWTTAPGPASWTTVNFVTESRRFTNIAFGNGTWVALVNDTIPYYSTNGGTTWFPAAVDLGPLDGYCGLVPTICFTEGKFVIASTGSGVVFTSIDGRNWKVHRVLNAYNYSVLLHLDGIFVLGGEFGDIAFSDNAEAWHATKPFVFGRILHGAAGNGRFLLQDGVFQSDYQFRVSTNGRDWTRFRANFPAAPVLDDKPGRWLAMTGLTFGRGNFILTANWGPDGGGLQTKIYYAVLLSTNGVDWHYPGDQYEPSTPPGPARFFNDRIYFDGFSTTNFINFEPSLKAVAFVQGDSESLAVVATNNNRTVLYRGSSFDSLAPGVPVIRQPQFREIAAVGPTLVGVTGNALSRATLEKSIDGGLNFRPALLPNPETRFYSVVASRGVFVAAGEKGTILTSRDGVQWTEAISNTDSALYAVEAGLGIWVAVGDQGTVIVSKDDGRTFTPTTIPGGDSFRDVVFGQGGFVAISPGGTMARSIDGSHWTISPRAPGAEFVAVAYGRGRYVGLTVDGDVSSSSNLAEWTVVRRGLNLSAIHYGSGVFFATGSFSTNAYYSIDGLDWILTTMPRVGTGVSASDGSLWLTGPELYIGRIAAIGLDARIDQSELELRPAFSFPGVYELMQTDRIDGGVWRVAETLTNAPGMVRRHNLEAKKGFWHLRLK